MADENNMGIQLARALGTAAKEHAAQEDCMPNPTYGQGTVYGEGSGERQFMAPQGCDDWEIPYQKK